MDDHNDEAGSCQDHPINQIEDHGSLIRGALGGLDGSREVSGIHPRSMVLPYLPEVYCRGSGFKVRAIGAGPGVESSRFRVSRLSDPRPDLCSEHAVVRVVCG